MWGGVVFRESLRPLPQGACSQRSPILGVPFYLCIHLYRRTTKFDVLTCARGVYLGVSHASHPKGVEFQRSLIFGFACIYLCPCPLMQNDQMRHGKIYGEGCVLGGQPRHCIGTNASRGLSAIAEFLVNQIVRFCMYM